MKTFQFKKISSMSIILNVLLWVLYFVSEKQLFSTVSNILHDVFTASALVIMLIVLIIIPYWLYRAILSFCIHKDGDKWFPINFSALCANFISYVFLGYIVYKPFVNSVIIILLLVFFFRKAIWRMKSKIAAITVFMLVCILGLSILFSPYYNPFDFISDYDKETFRTDFGDKITFIYEEYNFPDLSCSLTITDSECEEPIYLSSDPPKHSISLREISQADKNNIYLSNEVFLIKNIETKEFTKREIAEIIPQNASMAYEKCKEILKVFICSGNVDWVVGYAEPFIINGDTDVINTVVNIGSADIILPDEPNWVGVDSHINAMYEEQIDVMRPELYDKDEDLYNAIEAEDAVAYCKELIEKYNLKYIGKNTIHDNCRKYNE